MTAQLRMRFRDSSWFDTAVLPAIQNAVARVTLKEFAFACDSSPSLLSDKLAERNGKGLRVRELCTLVEIAPPAAEQELLAALITPRGFEAPKRREPLTAAEKLERIERELANLGPFGAHVLRSALGDR